MFTGVVWQVMQGIWYEQIGALGITRLWRVICGVPPQMLEIKGPLDA